MLLKGLSLSGARICVGLPPLASMFNAAGTAYAADGPAGVGQPIESRFVFWFNGNGIPEPSGFPPRPERTTK